MAENQELVALLKRFISGADDLSATHEYVTLHLTGVPNELLDYVAMEIWQYQDGYVPEDELRPRLALILAEAMENSAVTLE